MIDSLSSSLLQEELGKISKRVFIVGCPRSGTTLLQGILAAHPEVHSLPETFFFAIAIHRNWFKRNMLWPAIKVRKYFLRMLTEMNREDLHSLGRIGIFQADYHVAFTRVMDRMALDAGKTIWVEKTPMHLYFIKEIQKLIPEAVTIHIVRDGRDVVASLVKVTRETSTQWARLRQRRKWLKWKGYSIAEAVERWNRDFSISKEHSKVPGNIVIKYEDIIQKPESVALKLCELLGLSFNEKMIDPATSYQQIVRQDEPWKANNARKIGANRKLFDNFFTRDEQEWIESHLVPYEI